MIRFCCEHCAHKISVHDKDVGKQGKCPKCGVVIIVPAESTIIEFHCEYCDRKISAHKDQADKKAICPKCKNTFIIPTALPSTSSENQVYSKDLKGRSLDSIIDSTFLDAQEQYKQKDESVGQSNDSEEAESITRRKLPWIVDIFLYPISRGGLGTIGIILFLQFLTDFSAAGFIICCGCFGGILGIVIRIIIAYSYMYWYFTECVRDSASGGLRAPVIFANMIGLGAMILHFLRIFSCYAFTFGPVTFYWGYTYFFGIEGNNVIILVLLAYGAFFFPMGTLAVVMFDSVNGLKPTLLIRSITSTFFPYCGLIVLFYCLGVMFRILRSRIILNSLQGGLFSWPCLAYIVSNILLIYFLLISGHLLGRFFYRYEDKLYWEV